MFTSKVKTLRDYYGRYDLFVLYKDTHNKKDEMDQRIYYLDLNTRELKSKLFSELSDYLDTDWIAGCLGVDGTYKVPDLICRAGKEILEKNPHVNYINLGRIRKVKRYKKGIFKNTLIRDVDLYPITNLRRSDMKKEFIEKLLYTLDFYML